MSGWGNNLCWRFQNSLISLSFMLHIHIFEDHLKVGISWNIVWGGVKFSVKLDPISTDIVAHCIPLHIIYISYQPFSAYYNTQQWGLNYITFLSRMQPFVFIEENIVTLVCSLQGMYLCNLKDFPLLSKQW